MRFESPVTDGGRIALEDLVLPSGETVPAGTVMVVSWSAANLDPAYFPDPLAVDLQRSPNRHIGFASGFHRCSGLPSRPDGDRGRHGGMASAHPRLQDQAGQ